MPTTRPAAAAARRQDGDRRSPESLGQTAIGSCLRLAAAVGCLVAVVAINALMRSRSFTMAGDAALDETGHLATTSLLLTLTGMWLPPIRPRAVLAATVLIDLDHIPMQLGWHEITRHTVRPYSHSLMTLILLLVVAARWRGSRRWLVLSIALGIGGHLVRDMATGGVALLWPLSRDPVTLDHTVYLGILAAGVARALVGAGAAGNWLRPRSFLRPGVPP